MLQKKLNRLGQEYRLSSVDLSLLILWIPRVASIDISFIHARFFLQEYRTGNRNVVAERAIHPRNISDKIGTETAALLFPCVPISYLFATDCLAILRRCFSLSLSPSLSLFSSLFSMFQHRDSSDITRGGDRTRAHSTVKRIKIR